MWFWYMYLLITPLVNRLSLDHDIIFIFLNNIEKIQQKHVMENGAFAPKEKMLHFPNILKYMIFQRH